MAARIPTEAEVIGYFQSLSNWGRWGKDDQLGTLNLVTPRKRLQAASLVHEGVTVSCSTTIGYERQPDLRRPPVRFMVESGEGYATGQKVTNRASQVAMEFIAMHIHGGAVTHLDSPAHFFWEGQMYNGRPAHLISTSLGATAEAVELARDGIVTRGVLVDVPLVRGVKWVERGEGVMPEDILAAEERCGFRVEEGDALLVRTGQLYQRNTEGPWELDRLGGTACQAACLPLFHQRGIALLGSDTTNDVIPSGYPRLPNPIHQVGLVALGLWVLDRADLEALAQACRQRNRWEFMLCIGPLRLSSATGSPVNPLAVF